MSRLVEGDQCYNILDPSLTKDDNFVNPKLKMSKIFLIIAYKKITYYRRWYCII